MTLIDRSTVTAMHGIDDCCRAEVTGQYVAKMKGRTSDRIFLRAPGSKSDVGWWVWKHDMLRVRPPTRKQRSRR